MPIILRLDRVMADRKMSLNELSEKVGVANVNLSKMKNGHISAIHKVTQKMAGVPMSMSFRYTEPDGYDRTEGYDHVITADYCGLLVGKIIRSSYIYEWKETEYGVLVNSRYILSGWVPRWACKAIYDHDYPEQKRFQDFLPDLYRSCVSAE